MSPGQYTYVSRLPLLTTDHNFSKQLSPVGRLLEKKNLFSGAHIPNYKNNLLHGKLHGLHACITITMSITCVTYTHTHTHTNIYIRKSNTELYIQDDSENKLIF